MISKIIANVDARKSMTIRHFTEILFMSQIYSLASPIASRGYHVFRHTTWGKGNRST